jgi:hypothetical protein
MNEFSNDLICITESLITTLPLHEDLCTMPVNVDLVSLQLIYPLSNFEFNVK